MMKRERTHTHEKFKGLVNVVPARDNGDLEVAENVDIDDQERLLRRKGHSAAVAAGAFSSLWSDGSVALAVKDGTDLVQVNPNYTTTTLRGGLTPGLDMAFAPLAGRVYYSNGAEAGVVDGGRSRTWGLEVPGRPTAVVVPGDLLPGRYQFAVTYLRQDGQESGAYAATLGELTSAGGFDLTLPAPSDPDVSRKAVYASRRDGTVLYRVATVDAGTTNLVYAAESQALTPLHTMHLSPPPAGELIDVFNGHTLVARGDVLYPSEAYSPELFDLRRGIRMGSRINMLVALDAGVYVGTDTDIVWLDGRLPGQWTYNRLMVAGAIRGAFTRCSKDLFLGQQVGRRLAVFATTEGICVGDDGGAVANLTRERYAYPAQDKGAVHVRQHRGTVQCLATLRGTERAANVSV